MTPYNDVNEILDLLLASVKAVLQEQFVGLYLYGSLASGDFSPETSDIDFLVVTAVAPSPETIAALEAMHHQIRTSTLKWAAKLEGSYIPQEALRRYQPNDEPRPTLNEGRFYTAPHGADWVIQRHILREQGVVVAGPPIQPMIDPVSAADLRWAVRQNLAEWWQPMIENPSWLSRSDYQAYAVLSMCRVLHALEFGEIASKVVAARWARETLGQGAMGHKWVELIEEALMEEMERPFDHLAEVIAFIQLTVERSEVLE